MSSYWIFISYRRHETAYHAKLIYEKLEKQFGRNHVFLDRESIQPGERFPEKIETALQSTNVLIALIEKDWLSIKNQDGQQRLSLNDDWVKLEIETAMSRNIPIIPVLFDKVQMPQKMHLPDVLKPFSDYHAIEISSDRIDFDIERLINAIEKNKERSDNKSTDDQTGNIADTNKTTGFKQPNNPKKLHLLCNRKKQALDFTLYFNKNLKKNTPIQLIFFYGPESNECPYSFIERLAIKEIKDYWENQYDSLKYKINKSIISIPEKKNDVNDQKNTLIQELYNSFLLIANDYKLSAFYQHPTFDKHNVIILYHEISIDKWNLKLLEWYINEHKEYSQFFCHNNVKPTLLLFFYIKVDGFKEKPSFFFNPCKRCQKMLDKLKKKIDKKFKPLLLEPLQPVDKDDVREWFSNLELEKPSIVEPEIEQIFGKENQMPMRKIITKLDIFITNIDKKSIDITSINADYKRSL
ncbi:TIR-like domain protein [Candidatus Magnetomorum sp. HK-1]|nr:TIR-like domain protein [Candidatus Magnetomorum sp. HK-1]